MKYEHIRKWFLTITIFKSIYQILSFFPECYLLDVLNISGSGINFSRCTTISLSKTSIVIWLKPCSFPSLFRPGGHGSQQGKWNRAGPCGVPGHKSFSVSPIFLLAGLIQPPGSSLNYKSESVSPSVLSDSLRQSIEFSRPDTRVGSRSLLQGIFPNQGSNPGLQHCRQILYQLSHKGSSKITKGRFKQLLIRVERGQGDKEEQSENNSAALGKGTGSPSRNIHKNIFELFCSYCFPDGASG